MDQGMSKGLLKSGARAVLNLSQYPIDELGSQKMTGKMDEWRRAYSEEGMCIVPNFVLSEGVEALVREASELLPIMYQHEVTGNAYLSAVDETVPEDHPLRRTEKTRTSTIACDQIPVTAALRQIYESPAMDELVRNIVSADEIFHYQCSMGAVNVAVMEEGDYLRWHFDQSEFVVSIHLQDPEGGGDYEYVRGIRSEDDPNYDGVRSVLAGDRNGVEKLQTVPGSLLVFRGKNTIHRVTPVRGKKPRLVLLFGYALNEGVCSSDFLLKMRYGRTTPWNPA